MPPPPGTVLAAFSYVHTPLALRTAIMESRAKVFGHPLHQMLIVFPLGLLGTAVVFDLIHLGTGNPRMAEVAFYMIAAGLVGGLVAAPPGLIDWLAIPSG